MSASLSVFMSTGFNFLLKLDYRLILVIFIVQCNIFFDSPVQARLWGINGAAPQSVSPPLASDNLSIRIGTLVVALVKWRRDWTRDIDSDCS